MCLHIKLALTNIVSTNTNVRKCLNENIYTPGVFDLEMKGGCFWGMFWKCGLERNRRRGVDSRQVGVGGGWVAHIAV